jgi:hypothetical protein
MWLCRSAGGELLRGELVNAVLHVGNPQVTPLSKLIPLRSPNCGEEISTAGFVLLLKRSLRAYSTIKGGTGGVPKGDPDVENHRLPEPSNAAARGKAKLGSDSCELGNPPLECFVDILRRDGLSATTKPCAAEEAPPSGTQRLPALSKLTFPGPPSRRPMFATAAGVPGTFSFETSEINWSEGLLIQSASLEDGMASVASAQGRCVS